MLALPEQVSFRSFPDLGDVVRMRIDKSTQLRRRHHETFTIATPHDFHGEAEYRYRSRTHSTNGSQISLMEPGEVHVATRLTAPFSFYALLIPQPVMTSAADELGLPERHLHGAASVVEHPLLYQLFQRLNHILDDDGPPLLRQEAFATALHGLFQVAFEEKPRPLVPMSRPLASLGRARDHLHAHFAETVSLADLAQEAGISRFHLVRAFAREYGLTPHRYQIHLRVEKARILLTHSLTIDEAARQTGFADASHLIRHFKRILTLTPGSYAQAVTALG